jgi:ABC-type amino acid transport substrate-binding protein
MKGPIAMRRFFRFGERLSLACLLVLFGFIVLSHGATLEEIKKAGVIRHLGIPYANFVSGSGDGMDVELVQLYAASVGVRYEFVKADWGTIFGDLTGKTAKAKGNEVEITGTVPIKGDVAADGITVLPWRQKLVDFSEPTFPNQVWLVARADSRVKPIKPSGNLQKDMAAVKSVIKGHSLITKKGTCLDPTLYNIEETSGTKIMEHAGSLNEIAPALLNKEADLTLLDVPDALVALQKWPGKIKIIGPVSDIQDMAAAFAKDSPELRVSFNAFLNKCKRDGTFLKLAKKYYPFAPNYFPRFFEKGKDRS